MKIFENYQDYQPDSKKPLILALGNFDGVHLGHQALIRYVIEQAKALNGIPAVFTFKGHPQKVLHPGRGPILIHTPTQKMRILEALGVEVCFLQTFTPDFSEILAEEFVSHVLVESLSIKEICIGFNARFGKGRLGDAELLRRMSQEQGFLFKQMEPVMIEDQPISSSLIRERIMGGGMQDVQKFLGRPYRIRGEVIHGEGRGRGIGFPTANVKLNQKLFPPAGVYVATAAFEEAPETEIPAVLNLGHRPTFDGEHQLHLEVHMLSPDIGDIYGKTLIVSFLDFLRPEQKFDSVKELSAQITQDIGSAKAFFEKNSYFC